MSLLSFSTGNVGVLIGNGNGTFRALPTLTAGSNRFPRGLSVADFNNDNCSDIAVVSNEGYSVGVFLGYSDGTFSAQTTFYTGPNSFPMSIVVTDFNKDNYMDIAVVNDGNRNVGVFLGYGNGSFEAQKTSFSGGGMNPYIIDVGDFNSDTLSDVVLTYGGKNCVGIMYGDGNGTFSGRAELALHSSMQSSFRLLVRITRLTQVD